MTNGTNGFTGQAVVTNGGTLVLGSGSALSTNASLAIGPGGTFNAGGNAFKVGPSTNATVIGSGNATPAILTNTSTVSFGSQPIVLNFDGTHPALTVYSTGLTLGTNVFTIKTASKLAAGTYTLVTNSVAITGNGPFTISTNSTAIPAGYTATVAVVGNTVQLTLTLPSPSIFIPTLSGNIGAGTGLSRSVGRRRIRATRSTTCRTA